MNFKQASPARVGAPLLTGLVWSFIVMAAAALISSVILTLGNQGEEALPFYAYVIHGISILIGSFVSGRRSGNKGWYHGGLLGLLYSAIILVIGFLSLDQGLGLRVLGFIAGAFVAGAIGGILGVNTSK